MMKNTLFIDTTNNKKTIVGIIGGEKKELMEEANNSNSSQNLLPLISKILNQEKLNFKDINEIQVNIGPGSFTGTRVGVTIANTLGWVLNIPVNGQKLASPKYESSKFD